MHLRPHCHRVPLGSFSQGCQCAGPSPVAEKGAGERPSGSSAGRDPIPDLHIEVKVFPGSMVAFLRCRLHIQDKGRFALWGRDIIAQRRLGGRICLCSALGARYVNRPIYTTGFSLVCASWYLADPTQGFVSIYNMVNLWSQIHPWHKAFDFNDYTKDNSVVKLPMSLALHSCQMVAGVEGDRQD